MKEYGININEKKESKSITVLSKVFQKVLSITEYPFSLNKLLIIQNFR